MPRTGRGGKREGKPGKAYGNRSDLNGTATVMPDSVRPYADRTLPASLPQGPQGAAPRSVAPTPTPAGIEPGALPPLDGVTQRPAEPLTAGLPVGPGPGPQPDIESPDPLEVLWAVYTQYPNSQLGRLLKGSA